ncbi:Tryptophan synthase alpha chain [Sandaracinus amylolyticus]|uniref:Tryptophan synthase alpha chain n=1 Tax=Sandaracinus amylolyticus TaxID=927083 RepID=A0A0F6SGP8_9BACT|nr:Tryptophan synthase alpha chain [Sandaracinus amylolyticus]
MVRRSLLPFLFLSIAACEADPLTEIVVVTDTDLDVPEGIDAIRITASDPQGVSQEALADLGGGAERPVTLGLVSRQGSGTLEVVVVGERDEVEILRRTARVSFVRGRTVALRMDLWEDCIGQLCGADRTCGDHGCRPVAIEASELVDWSGEPPPAPDASLALDGGGMDAGVRPDAQVPIDAHVPRDAPVDARMPSDAPMPDAPMVDAFVEQCNDAMPCPETDSYTCTIDRCVEGRCVVELSDAACDDGVECTSERCDLGLGCVYQTHDDRCDDGVACTADRCDQLEGCVHQQQHTTCGTGSYCDTTAGCATAPTFTEVYTTVIATRCGPCHITNTPRSGRLDLSTQALAYTTMVGVTAGCGAGVNTLVVPGDSARSLLWRKVANVDLCGSRMPRGMVAPLDEAQISLIARWIQGGALE